MERKGFLDRLLEEDARITEDGKLALQELWGKTQARVKTETAEDPPDESEKIRTLEVMPEDVKVLYVRILVAQCFVDGELNPIKVADIYLFMSKISLSPDSREEIRRFLAAGEAQPPGVVDLAKEVVSKVQPDERDVVAFSIVKDMTWISRTDGIVLPSARASIRAVAEAFGKDAEEVMKLADKIIEHEEAMIKGDMSASELEKGMKDIVAVAAATSVPVTALFFSGSVVGLSAAGITSGLAALGLGGVLGLSAMVTGIGAVVVLGVVAYLAAQRAMGGKERELAKKREHMIQQIIKQHQDSISDLAADIKNIAARMEDYTSKSERNEERLARLNSELRMFKDALGALEGKRERYAS
jgi:hypothetical protein